VGLPTPDTQLRVVDPETLEPVSEGRQGLVLARGPGVMAGYFRDEAATARAFRAGDGWLDTGESVEEASPAEASGGWEVLAHHPGVTPSPPPLPLRPTRRHGSCPQLCTCLIELVEVIFIHACPSASAHRPPPPPTAACR
jgi:hypothetical protein